MTPKLKFVIVKLMIKRGLKKGFTVVELLIVIVVMALLATMIALAYGSAQNQAYDTKKRDAFDKFVDALSLWSAANKGTVPYGGWNSSGGSVYNTDKENCTNPGNLAMAGWQDYNMKTVNPTNYGCTLGDVLVNGGYLPETLFTELPHDEGVYNFMVYACPTDASGRTLIVMGNLASAKPEDTTNFDSTFNACFGASLPNGGADNLTVFHNTYKMQQAKKLTLAY